ncbi:MAG: 2-oxo acid dehydrogenase subunit E2 [Planctomycetales bacterium]|nr:2-oxo acid dehydrogenase subunit E2 [Planctomycetales bacterium]
MYIIKYRPRGGVPPEGVVTAWAVKEGNAVKKGDLLVEIEAAGAAVQVETAIEGTIRKELAGTGTPLKSGDALAIIGQPGEDISGILAQLTPPKPVPCVQCSPKGEVPAGVKAVKPEKVKQNAGQTPAFPKKEEFMTSQQPVQQAVGSQGVVPILMPQAGQSMEEGTILSWKVKEGDRVEVGQVIMDIETDKATMEVEAVDAGRVAKIVSREGEIVGVKMPVAYLAPEGVDIDACLASAGPSPHAPLPAASVPSAAAAAPKASTAPKTAASVSESGRVKASPAARKAAADKGIELAAIGAGSGPGGRILSADVQNAEGMPSGTQVHAVSKMRRAIANNLLYSKQNIPHFYAKVTIDAGALFAVYRQTKEQFKCSVNDFVTRACAKAIRRYPAFRSQYQNAQMVENPAVNIGIAVGTENGLTVPVVLNADRMSLEQLAARSRQVVEAARSGKLEGIGQGVFTITNLGMFGVEEFSAIINPPESAILAVGAVREGAAVENGVLRATRLMTVTLSVDHRVIDGVMAAQFLQTLKELLEKPQQLVG